MFRVNLENRNYTQKNIFGLNLKQFLWHLAVKVYLQVLMNSVTQI